MWEVTVPWLLGEGRFLPLLRATALKPGLNWLLGKYWASRCPADPELRVGTHADSRWGQGCLLHPFSSVSDPGALTVLAQQDLLISNPP